MYLEQKKKNQTKQTNKQTDKKTNTTYKYILLS